MIARSATRNRAAGDTVSIEESTEDFIDRLSNISETLSVLIGMRDNETILVTRGGFSEELVTPFPAEVDDFLVENPEDCYFCISPLKPIDNLKTTQKGSRRIDANVSHRSCLFVDIDPPGHEEKKPIPPEAVALAKKTAEEIDTEYPCFLMDFSGAGFHLFYRVPDNYDHENALAFLRSKWPLVGMDGKPPSRLCRVPFTKNMKRRQYCLPVKVRDESEQVIPPDDRVVTKKSAKEDKKTRPAKIPPCFYTIPDSAPHEVVLSVAGGILAAGKDPAEELKDTPYFKNAKRDPVQWMKDHSVKPVNPWCSRLKEGGLTCDPDNCPRMKFKGEKKDKKDPTEEAEELIDELMDTVDLFRVRNDRMNAVVRLKTVDENGQSADQDVVAETFDVSSEWGKFCLCWACGINPASRMANYLVQAVIKRAIKAPELAPVPDSYRLDDRVIIGTKEQIWEVTETNVQPIRNCENGFWIRERAIDPFFYLGPDVPINEWIDMFPVEKKNLLAAWIAQAELVKIRKKEPRFILIGTGDPGSGKTSMFRFPLIARFGWDSDVETVPTTKQDERNMHSVMAGCSVVVFDEGDKVVRNFGSLMASASTGAKSALRKLFTTLEKMNEEMKPIMGVSATSVTPTHPGLSQRIYTINLSERKEFTVDSTMFSIINRDRWWSSYINFIKRYLAEEKTVDKVRKTRMAATEVIFEIFTRLGFHIDIMFENKSRDENLSTRDPLYEALIQSLRTEAVKYSKLIRPPDKWDENFYSCGQLAKIFSEYLNENVSVWRAQNFLQAQKEFLGRDLGMRTSRGYFGRSHNAVPVIRFVREEGEFTEEQLSANLDSKADPEDLRTNNHDVILGRFRDIIRESNATLTGMEMSDLFRKAGVADPNDGKRWLDIFVREKLLNLEGTKVLLP